MSIYLAIDVGGTKTAGLLADETRTLARAATGTVKLMRVGEEEASARLRGLLRELSLSAGVPLANVSRTCIGLAGYAIEQVRQWAEREITSVTGGELLLCGDEDVALDAAFHGGEGILLIAGTGSNVVGRAADGTIYHAGGWGPALGDEGSGYWIGQEALRNGFRARDRGIPTTLLDQIGAFWKMGTIGELVEKANQRPGPDFAALAPIVAQCAEQGDMLARSVLAQAGEELARQVIVVSTKIQQTGSENEVGLAYTGGVIEHNARVRESLTGALARSAPRVRLVPGAVDALEGALWRARHSSR